MFRYICLMVRWILLILILAQPVSAEVVQGRARVIDGDTLAIGAVHVRLAGIDAPERGQLCTDERGRAWPCGTRATERLRGLIGRNEVRCEGVEHDRYDRLVGTCAAGDQALNAVLVREGLAFAYRKYSLAYIGAEDAARAARRGLWAGQAEEPAVLRAERSGDPAPTGNCLIKGNISDRGQLYHLPGTRGYAATRINLARGERWFCTEAEAQAAGWRRAGG